MDTRARVGRSGVGRCGTSGARAGPAVKKKVKSERTQRKGKEKLYRYVRDDRKVAMVEANFL